MGHAPFNEYLLTGISYFEPLVNIKSQIPCLKVAIFIRDLMPMFLVLYHDS